MARFHEGSIYVNGLSEFLVDRLSILSFVHNCSISSQIQTIIEAYILDYERDTADKIAYLARKRGLTVSEFEEQVLTGAVQRLAPDNSLIESDKRVSRRFIGVEE